MPASGDKQAVSIKVPSKDPKKPQEDPNPPKHEQPEVRLLHVVYTSALSVHAHLHGYISFFCVFTICNFNRDCSSLLQDSLAPEPAKEAKGGKDKGKLKAGEPEELNEVCALHAISRFCSD
jgi:hypothetical protein